MPTTVKDKWKQLQKCKTLSELSALIPEEGFTTVIFLMICVYIWLPVSWFYRVISPEVPQLLLVPMNFFRLIPRQITLFFTGFFLLYLLGRTKGHRLKALKSCFSLKEKPFHVFLLLYLIWIFISCICSPDVSLAFRGTFERQEGFWTYLEYGCLFFLASHVKAPRHRRLLFYQFSIAAAVNAVFVLLQYRQILYPFRAKSTGPLHFAFSHYSGYLAYASHYGYFVVLALLCICAFLCIAPKKLRIPLILEALFLTWTIAINGNENAFFTILITLCISIVLVALINSSYAKIIGLEAVGFLLACAIVCFLPENCFGSPELIENIFHVQISDASKKEDAEPSENHQKEYAREYICEHPILGNGPDQRILRKDENDTSENTRLLNEYLYLLLAFGFPGVLFYIGALLSGIGSRLRRIKSIPPGNVLTLIPVIGYCISAIRGYSVFTVYPYFVILFAFCLTPTSPKESEAS